MIRSCFTIAIVKSQVSEIPPAVLLMIQGVFALAEVAKEGYPDCRPHNCVADPRLDTAWDPKHPYFDEKTDKEKPIWFMVGVVCFCG